MKIDRVRVLALAIAAFDLRVSAFTPAGCETVEPESPSEETLCPDGGMDAPDIDAEVPEEDDPEFAAPVPPPPTSSSEGFMLLPGVDVELPTWSEVAAAVAVENVCGVLIVPLVDGRLATSALVIIATEDSDSSLIVREVRSQRMMSLAPEMLSAGTARRMVFPMVIGACRARADAGHHSPAIGGGTVLDVIRASTACPAV